MAEKHHPLCNEGVQAGDQRMPCDCPEGWPKVGIDPRDYVLHAMLVCVLAALTVIAIWYPR